MTRSASVRAAAFAGLALAAWLAVVPAAAPAVAAAVAPTAPTAAPAADGTITDQSGTDTSAPGKEYVLTPKTTDTAPQALLGNFARVLVGLSGSVALLMFVWAGISMILADGDEKKIAQAKGIMTWTAVGLVVIFSAEALVRFVLGALLQGTVS
jgi:hypothetical protein